jgi:hypothetical protein
MAVHTSDQSAPARNWLAVTPSDTVNLPAGCRGLFVATAGTLSLVGADNVAVTFTITDTGRLLPLGVKRVNAAGTSSTGIVALY